MSIVVVEQQFSAGGNILDSSRSSINLNLIEVQTCLDNWTKIEFRQQGLDQESMYKYFENDQTMETEGSDD